MNNKELLIKDFMHKHPHTIGADQTAGHAKKEMATLGIRHLPVLSAGKCVGIISDRDIKLAFAVDGKSAEALKVVDICVGDVYTVPPHTPIKEVAATMVKLGVGSAVIVEHDAVIGIFTTTDACKALAHCL